ncbi:iron-sulfur cluster assembly accessory protein [Reinekea sp. G2M2-21]|uniref:HesB/IscA family protein n=1 Tax=Reinekea sp. G2M2-21 TaxID=2788942 RepID=UPI0018AC2435|nr:iron-sulfur cluster assembly accessory protein [Reinekea sp. G2M2-21]
MSVQSFDPNGLDTNLDIRMTDSAIAHFNRQLIKAGEKAVRLFIEESGCSGYMYRIALVTEPVTGDIKVAINDNLVLYVQNEARAIVQGTEIDFKKDGLNEVIKFNNPNVTGECGCGESFVVESD